MAEPRQRQAAKALPVTQASRMGRIGRTARALDFPNKANAFSASELSHGHKSSTRLQDLKHLGKPVICRTVGIVEVLDLQPLRFLSRMYVFLKVVHQQHLVRRHTGDKPKVLCLPVPSDVFDIRKPIGCDPFIHQQARDRSESIFLDGGEHDDARKNLGATSQEICQTRAGNLAHRIRDQGSFEIEGKNVVGHEQILVWLAKGSLRQRIHTCAQPNNARQQPARPGSSLHERLNEGPVQGQRLPSH
ncbi:hypothetical protein SAMN05216567_112143 [Variovorax sp. OK605]|nr:hypothetical protein SAMN05216567_112143 [Variovorax sp. OK605]